MSFAVASEGGVLKGLRTQSRVVSGTLGAGQPPSQRPTTICMDPSSCGLVSHESESPLKVVGHGSCVEGGLQAGPLIVLRYTVITAISTTIQNRISALSCQSNQSAENMPA